MKKVLFTAMAAMAMFVMVACNNNKAAEATEDTTACAAQWDKPGCDGSCCQCGEECKAAKCEGCEKCGTPECCGENAGKCCKTEKACKDNCQCGDECKAANCEGCPNHGTENCCKAKAGQTCEKACEKQCEKQCEKACEKQCEKKCEKAQ